jgi:hypothetical protein
MTTLPEWPSPEWHPDYGDAKAEVAHLRTCAVAIGELKSDYELTLAVPEPGLMYLEVKSSSEVLAEIYSIAESRDGPRRYGIFTFPRQPNEGENYFSDALSAAAYVVAALGQLN